MRQEWIAVAVLGALVATPASAQGVNLSGKYRCVQNCIGSGPDFVTQNAWDLNLTNEAGQSSRAWIDYPGHIWAQYWNEGAVYSPDGMTIQFDRGSVWRRIIEPMPDVVAYCARRFKSYDPESGTYLAHSGLRRSCP